MFKKYSSLENHTNGKFLEKVQDAIDSGECLDFFVARSKLHGCNYSVIITKDSIQPAKRSGPIEVTEKFFNYQDLMKKYEQNFKDVQSTVGNNVIQIFGEYAGEGIQKEIDYGQKDFYVFDVMVNGEYVNDMKMKEICLEFGFRTAPLLGYGTLAELLKLPVEYESVIKDSPVSFVGGLEIVFNQVPPKGNPEEGIVIKPVKPTFLRTGSRIAIKYKTDAFKEKKKGQAPKIPTPLTDKDKQVLAQFNEYITWNRISNVISHIGEVTQKDFGKVMGLTMKDIFTEAEREGLTINQADAPSKLTKELQKLVTTEIRTKWLEVIS